MSLREWFGLLAAELRCTTNDFLFAYATRAGVNLGALPPASAEDRARSGENSPGEPPSGSRSVPTPFPLAAASPQPREGGHPGVEIRGPHTASHPRPGSPSKPIHDWEKHATAQTFGKAVPGCPACPEKAVQR